MANSQTGFFLAVVVIVVMYMYFTKRISDLEAMKCGLQSDNQKLASAYYSAQRKPSEKPVTDKGYATSYQAKQNPSEVNVLAKAAYIVDGRSRGLYPSVKHVVRGSTVKGSTTSVVL